MIINVEKKLVEYIEGMEQEIKQLKEKNKHIEQWWKETNVIIRNEKSLAVNDNAMNYIVSLENKIDKAIEDLKGTLKINRHYIEETKYGKNEWICMDIDHIQELIDMLEEVKENG